MVVGLIPAAAAPLFNPHQAWADDSSSDIASVIDGAEYLEIVNNSPNPWKVSEAKSLVAGNLGVDNSTSEIEFEARTSGTLSFGWRVNSEIGYSLYDYMTIINADESEEQIGGLSKEGSFSTSLGVAQKVTVKYKKDSSTSVTNENAELYSIEFIPDCLHESRTDTVSESATCTIDGSRSYHCNECNQDIIEVLPATGHNWDWEHARVSGDYATAVCLNESCTETKTKNLKVSEWDGSAEQIEKGLGTEEDPYQIETAAQLAYVAKQVNENARNYAGTYFELTTDVSLEDLPWEPIGGASNRYFSGNFDGLGHTISGLNVKGSATSCSYGLFGYVKGSNGHAKISNLIVDGEVNVTAASGNGVAGICGYAENAEFENLSNNTNVTSAMSATGGIVGKNNTSSDLVVKNCNNKGDITTTNYYVGGIVGQMNYPAKEKTNTIESCYNSGNLRADKNYAGGIAGYVYMNSENGDTVIRNCYNVGLIAASTYKGQVLAYFSGYGSVHKISLVSIFGSEDLDENVYWSIGSSSVAPTDYLTQLSSDELKAIPEGLNADAENPAFVEDSQDINNGYPVLAWEIVDIPSIPVDQPTVATDLVYNGETQSGIIVPEADSAAYTITNGEAVNAGDYRATVTLNSGYAWADAEGDAANEPLTLDWSIAKADSTVTLDPADSELNLTAGSNTQAIAVAATGAGIVTATSSDDAIATVEYDAESGILTIAPVAAGTAIVAISTTGDDNWNAAQAEITVTVSAPAVNPPAGGSGGGSVAPAPPSAPGQDDTNAPSDGEEITDDDTPLAPGPIDFIDVAADHWVVTEGWLDYVAGNGIMTGADKLFRPDADITRAEVATILYRAGNADAAATTDPAQYAATSAFSDVLGGNYYTAAINWCKEQGIVSGYGDTGTFGPHDPVTRAQLMKMLAEYARVQGADIENASEAALAAMPDAPTMEAFAKPYAAWCTANGIITGSVENGIPYLRADAHATRAQLAKMITVTMRDVLD